MTNDDEKVEIKDPSELSEEEQEARQTGLSVVEVRAAKPAKIAKTAKVKTKKAKTSKDKPAKKSAKAKPAKPAKKAANGMTKAGTKVKRPNAIGKTGPKGSKKPQRNAKDEGVFGRKLARARKAIGMTQAILAAKVGLTQPSVCNIEKGTVGASEKIQAKMAKAVGL